MDGSASGAMASHDQRSGQFTAGNTEYRAKQRRIAERAEQLCAEYDPTPSQRMLLLTIARHLDDAERGRSAIVRTRASNVARRMLRDIPRKRVSEPPPAPNHVARISANE
jgi:hypothetical protein